MACRCVHVRLRPRSGLRPNTRASLCSTAVGVKCKDGVILGVEKLIAAKMLVAGSGRRIHTVDEHVGAAVAGLMPDTRQLVLRAREEARGHKANFGEPMPPYMLAEHMGGFMHLFTVYWYLRPFGASILLAAFDKAKGEAELYCAEPTGMSCVSTRPPHTQTHRPPSPAPPPPPVQRYHGYALGKGARAAKTEIEKGRFGEKSVEEALNLVAKILVGVHDDTKDKPMEVELSWISAATGWKHVHVTAARRDAAVAWAKQAVEDEEMGDDD